MPQTDCPNFQLGPARNPPPEVVSDEPLEAGLAAEALRRQVAELTRENAGLSETVAARDAFLAIAGHELRNPMTPILGRVDLLKRLVSRPDFEPERVRQGLEQVEWLIRQYMKRATTLLDVSRITSGKLALSRAPVELCGVARQVVENFRPIAEHAGCTLASDLPDGSLIACGDPLAVEEIVDNLVSNAIKYGRGKPVLVSAVAGPDGEYVSLAVRDQGPGISAAHQGRIFERFERAVADGERNSGFGVGLWIVRQLAEAMGGKIEVVSEAGVGSTFCVTLPTRLDDPS